MDIPKSEKEIEEKPFPFFHPISRRFHLILLLMVLIFCSSWMRGNLSMTMTCMVNTTAVSINSKSIMTKNLNNDSKTLKIATQCLGSTNGDENIPIVNDYGGTIIWSSKIQNWLFSASFYGALITSIPAGYLADRKSPTTLMLISMFMLVISTALFPVMAMHTTWHFVFVTRVFTGCGNGLIMPTINVMITKWIPNKEKSLAASIFTSGNQLAGILGLPLAAAFCASRWKWPMVFYCGAIIGLIWLLIWKFTVKNSPKKTKCITPKELAYLERNLGEYKPKKKNYTIPWLKIFTSLPVLCCILSGLAFCMINVIMQIYLPTFFKEVLFLKVVDNGLYSAAPFVIQIVAKLLWSILIVRLRGKYLTNTSAVKLSQGLSSILITIFMILLGYLPDCRQPWIAVLLFFGVSCGFGMAINGFYVSLISLAPAYTGILTSIHMVTGFIAMIATPQLVSFFKVYGLLEEWRMIFFIVAGMAFSTGVIFVLFAEAEIQPWAKFDFAPNAHNLLSSKDFLQPIMREKANSIIIE